MRIKQSRNLTHSISDLKETEKGSVELFKRIVISDDGNFFPVDFLAIAALKRTSGNTEGFLTLVESKNMSAARSLLRIQLDTFLRFSSLWLVDNPHDYASEILAGKHIRNIKDRNSKKMTDRYLIEHLSKEHPWLSAVYEKLSGYVHFSGQHIFDSIQKLDDDGRFSLFVGKEDTKYPEWSWVEIVDCFHESIQILFHYLEG